MIICCPDCGSGAEKRESGNYRCNTCRLTFHESDGVLREKKPHRRAGDRRVVISDQHGPRKRYDFAPLMKAMG